MSIEPDGIIKLIKWKGNPEEADNHRHDYRWIKNKQEQEDWIRKYWVVEEELK